MRRTQQWTPMVADWAPGEYYTLTQANGLVAHIYCVGEWRRATGARRAIRGSLTAILGVSNGAVIRQGVEDEGSNVLEASVIYRVCGCC